MVHKNEYLRQRKLFTLTDRRSVTYSVCDSAFSLRVKARIVPFLLHASKDSHFCEETDLICLVIWIIMTGEDI